jgi:hypothetical protein
MKIIIFVFVVKKTTYDVVRKAIGNKAQTNEKRRTAENI